ncbi:MAG: chromate transporter [Bacteroidales bacterium]|nr:chromate transporter [Bacteroidales bacterium]
MSLFKLFTVFLKIGAFTIGGGYAMIPVIENEMNRRGWIAKEDIDDIVVLAQSAPGLLAVNMAIFTGHRLRGMKGSLAATLGSILPSFVIILLIAMVFTNFQDNEIVVRIFTAIRPVSVALILVPAVKMMQRGCKTWWAWLITIATVLLVAFLKVSPIWIILVLVVCAAGISAWRNRR